MNKEKLIKLIEEKTSATILLRKDIEGCPAYKYLLWTPPVYDPHTFKPYTGFSVKFEKTDTTKVEEVRFKLDNTKFDMTGEESEEIVARAVSLMYHYGLKTSDPEN